MNYKPPLRNSAQMVRVVRDQANSATSYQLGNAYGDNTSDPFAYTIGPTQLQLRTLEAMGLPSTSIRRPGPSPEGGILSTRASSTLYHDLNNETRQYISGSGGPQALRRQDGQPGTKLRSQLGHDAFSKSIYSMPNAVPQKDHLAGNDKPADKKGESPFKAFD